MKIWLWIILFTGNYIWAADIQSDVEDILHSEFPGPHEITLQKYTIPIELKSQAEKQIQQKFYKNYIYLWKICHDDSISGYAILDNTYGKSLPITFLTMFSPTGEIRRLDIIRYREPYGGAIGSRRWLDQFIGKSVNDKFNVDDDIDSISGATISVKSVTRAVNKLAIVINQYIMNNSHKCIQKHNQIKSNAK